MKPIILMLIFAFVVSCEAFRITSTKCPPVSATLKSFVTAVPTMLKYLNIDDTIEKIRNYSLFAARIGVMIYSCLSIAILCDCYFVPALEFIGSALSLPNDITGALFTPLGTAGPEVFSSIVGVFFSNNNIGTGAIIGSAVINLVFVPAMCSFTAIYFRGEILKMSPINIIRDLVLYILTIISLILVIEDNKIDLIEAFMLVIQFVIFGIFIYYNSQLMQLMKSALKPKVLRIDSASGSDISDIECDNSVTIQIPNEKTPLISPIVNKATTSEHTDYCSLQSNSFCPNLSHENVIEIKSKDNSIKTIQSNESEDEESCFLKNTFIRILTIPIVWLFSITIPKPSKKFFVVTFVVSILWLSGLTFFTVNSVEFISEYMKISDSVSGIVILAFGSAVPDMVTSVIIVKKKGLVDMGICGAIASNRFAILIGLGLPWTIKCTLNWISKESFALNPMILHSDALSYTSLLLLIAIFGLFFNFKYHQWSLTLRFGIICMMIYATFVSLAITLEFLLADPN